MGPGGAFVRFLRFSWYFGILTIIWAVFACIATLTWLDVFLGVVKCVHEVQKCAGNVAIVIGCYLAGSDFLQVQSRSICSIHSMWRRKRMGQDYSKNAVLALLLIWKYPPAIWLIKIKMMIKPSFFWVPTILDSPTYHYEISIYIYTHMYVYIYIERYPQYISITVHPHVISICF